MASILRQIVAGPRARHPDADLDLCYVTDNIIATSGPGASYPQVAYRNPLKDLVKFLDSRHGDNWAIWEFRAEGTGYPDEDVYGRIRHYPWPDHHPPPFALIPLIMASMRNWLKDKEAEGKGRVAVVHCKAGKGRSGTISCSYLISEEGWTPEDAMQRFTERRMRAGFVGISIPSQRRTISYVDRWTKHGKTYVEKPVEILEIHLWGLRNAVKVAVEGYVDEGKVIKTFHTFDKRNEREIVRGSIIKEAGFADAALEFIEKLNMKQAPAEKASDSNDQSEKKESGVGRAGSDLLADGGDVIFRPSERVVLPTSDVNIDFERRKKSKYATFPVPMSRAHVWFNAFFEGRGPERNGAADTSGVFEIEWDAMDGVKGTSSKGTRAFDKMAVVWKTVDVLGDGLGRTETDVVIKEPDVGEEVKEAKAADWRMNEERNAEVEKKLGLMSAAQVESAAVSCASSVNDLSRNGSGGEQEEDEIVGVKRYGPTGEEGLDGADEKPDGAGDIQKNSKQEPASDTAPSHVDGLPVAGVVNGVQRLSTADLRDGRPESEVPDSGTAMSGSSYPAQKEERTAS
jgi:protein-tyrosine phosphatase